MGLFSRRKPAATDAPTDRGAREATLAHLKDFVATRVGVEAYVEPQTNSTPTTMMLVATDGEWTRRRVPDPKTAWELARDMGIPVYDVQRTGYPQRVRDWNSRQRLARKRKHVLVQVGIAAWMLRRSVAVAFERAQRGGRSSIVHRRLRQTRTLAPPVTGTKS